MRTEGGLIAVNSNHWETFKFTQRNNCISRHGKALDKHRSGTEVYIETELLSMA